MSGSRDDIWRDDVTGEPLTDDIAGEDDSPDFPDKGEDGDEQGTLTPEEAKAKYEESLAEADKRGGTPKGEVIVEKVKGRRLS